MGTQNLSAEAFATLPVAVAHYSAEAELQAWNRAFEAFIAPVELKAGMTFSAVVRAIAPSRVAQGHAPDVESYVATRLNYHGNIDGYLERVVDGRVYGLFETFAEDGSWVETVVDISQSRHAHRERLLSVLQSTPEDFAYFDPEDRLRLWNNNFAVRIEQRCGQPPLEGETFESLMRRVIEPSSLADADKAELLRARVAEQRARVSHMTDAPNFKVSRTATPDGGCILLITDLRGVAKMENTLESRTNKLIDSNLTLEKNRQLLRTVLDAIPQLVAYFNADDELEIWNQAYESAASLVLGRPPNRHEKLATVIEARVKDMGLDPQTERSTLEREFCAYKENGRSDFEWRSKRLVLDRVPVDSGGRLLVFTDVTSEAAAQRTLELHARRLERTNQALQSFATIASHDLQEPLRTMSTFADLLRRKNQDHLDSESLQYIDFIIEGATRMRSLTQDLLEYARIHRTGVTEEFSLQEVVAELAEEFHNLVETESAKLVFSDLPSINADRTLLQLLLRNLSGNAFKYRSDAPPRIEITVCESKTDWIISVADNGIGIDPKYQERIFEIFKRLHSTEEYPGTGIGLAICKRIVEGWGGTIWVESELDNGALFRFSVPRGLTPISS